MASSDSDLQCHVQESNQVQPGEDESSQFSQNPDWMSTIDELCDASLGDIIWPGTHDSGANIAEFDYSKVATDGVVINLFACCLNSCIGLPLRGFVSKWARAQNLSICEQLEHGIRFLDLRVGKSPSNIDDTYYVCHSFIGPPLENVLREIAQFMQQNTKECLLIEVAPFGSFLDHTQLHTKIKEILGDLMLKRNHGSPFLLKFSHLLEKGRILVFYKLPNTVYNNREWPSKFCPFFWDSSFLCDSFKKFMEPKGKEAFLLKHFESFIDKCSCKSDSDHNTCTCMFHFMYALTPGLCAVVKPPVCLLGSLCCCLNCSRSLHIRTVKPSNLEECAQMINPCLGSFFETIKETLKNTCTQKCRGFIFSVDFVEQSELMKKVIDANKEQLKH